MKKVKSYKDFLNEAETAEPAVKPRTKPTTTPAPTKQPGRPSPYRKDKPSVTPAPKASAEDVANKFLSLTKNNKDIQSLLKKTYKKGVKESLSEIDAEEYLDETYRVIEANKYN